MATFTPQQIVDALHEADREMVTVSQQLAWFKGQRDYWKQRLELCRASAEIHYTGPATKAKAYGIDASANTLVQIPWLPPGNTVSLPQMLRLAESSFDLVSQEYSRLESHVMILMAVNKNVMQDYANTNVMNDRY